MVVFRIGIFLGAFMGSTHVGRRPLLCVPRQLFPALPYLGNRSCVALAPASLQSSCVHAVVHSRHRCLPARKSGGPFLRFLIFRAREDKFDGIKFGPP